jgi:hypothetical protein
MHLDSPAIGIGIYIYKLHAIGKIILKHRSGGTVSNPEKPASMAKPFHWRGYENINM